MKKPEAEDETGKISNFVKAQKIVLLLNITKK